MAGIALGHPKEEPPGRGTLARSRPDCGDVSSEAPCLESPTPLLSEQMVKMSQERNTWFSTARGAARGYLTGPFAARLWGCPSDVFNTRFLSIQSPMIIGCSNQDTVTLSRSQLRTSASSNSTLYGLMVSLASAYFLRTE